ncbi:MAG TPA: hypothetical protein VNO82_25415 [Solirubrobacteraceae bacterium]|nr:hypothetical protein [Solirubrobacteraceae bacterium]
MEQAWSPRLAVLEVNGRCRLSLGGQAYGDGETLQDAADALVARLLQAAMSWRSGAIRFSPELGAPDVAWFQFLHELGEIAAAGGDIRERVLGCPPNLAA